MTLRHLIRSSLVAALLGGVMSTALGAAAVAIGNGDYTYTITEAASVKSAKAEALEECGKRVENCRIFVWTAEPGAIALAKGDNGASAIIADTPEQARSQVMTNCRKNYRNCRFTALYWEPGGTWAAWAHALDDQQHLVGNYFVSNAASEAEAREDALANCRKQQAGQQLYECKVMTHWGDMGFARVSSRSHTSVQVRPTQAEAVNAAMSDCKAELKAGEACKLISKGFNSGSRPQPASFDKLAAQTEMARREARPVRRVSTQAVQNLSCTNRCVNGSCVRTFADGRTEQWQAPRVFDPLINDWKWDTNSCGG